MKLGEAHKIDVATIPTGSLSLDLALGGGLPQGGLLRFMDRNRAVRRLGAARGG
jgi:hypothetical protein